MVFHTFNYSVLIAQKCSNQKYSNSRFVYNVLILEENRSSSRVESETMDNRKGKLVLTKPTSKKNTKNVLPSTVSQ